MHSITLRSSAAISAQRVDIGATGFSHLQQGTKRSYRPTPDPTGSTDTGEFVGFTQPDFNDGVTSNFAQLIGRWQFARNDNTTAYAKFFPDIGAVAVGDINTVNIGTEDLLLRRDGSDAELLIQTATSGNAELNLEMLGTRLIIFVEIEIPTHSSSVRTPWGIIFRYRPRQAA